jgi:hypothetical protein
MNRKTLLPAALALGISAASVMGSACFTSMVLHDARQTTEARTPALRVRHCYLTPKNELLVLAEGGAWRADPAATAPEKISFALKLDELAKQANGKEVPALPQSILHAGWPGADFLQTKGYQEIVFAEHRYSKPVATDNEAIPRVVVLYQYTIAAPTFGEYVGEEPVFEVRDVPTLPVFTFSVADTHISRHLGPLLLIPVAVPLDIVTSPLQLLFLLSYKGG